MTTGDNRSIHQRVEDQISLLLDEMEEQPERFAFKDRLAVITTLGMYLTRDLKLKAADEPASTGSAVRKYSGAFRAHGTGGGTKHPRSAAKPVPIRSVEPDDTDSDDTAA
jgi:hypothetical protein